MADTNSTTTAKRLTRAALAGQECRISALYGASTLGIRIFLGYARAVGKRYVAVEESLPLFEARGITGFQNVHGEPCSATWYARRKLTHGQRFVRESIAREQRGERPFMRMRQAG